MFRADIIPVAEAVIDDVIVRAAAEIGQIFVHRVVMRAEQIQVAVELVLLPGHEDEGAAPFRRIAEYPAQMIRVAPVAEDGVFRRGGRHQAVGKLRIGHVVQHFGEQLREVEFIAQGRAVQVILLQPAAFFALRTIGHHAHHVAALRPADELADAVEERVGTFKFTDRLRRGMHDHAFDFFHDWKRSAFGCRQALDLQITAADVEEFREIIFARPYPPTCIATRRLATAARTAIH